MLIRLANDDLLEYPDDLGALVLADPTQGDVPDFSLEELNCLISGALGMLFDEGLTLEQNIEQAREHYTRWGSPSAANMEKARAQIKNYKENIAEKDIGYSDRELINEFYGIQSSSRKFDDNVIDEAPRSVVKVAALGTAPSGAAKTLAHGEAQPDTLASMNNVAVPPTSQGKNNGGM
jgi:hypothetical protein